MKKAAAKRRTNAFTLAAAERVCAVIAEGGTQRTVARELGVPRSTLCGWLKRYPKFAERYAAACEVRLDLLEERLLELCADAHEAALLPETGKLQIEACKLEIDTCKFMLAKLRPKRFGDRTQMEVTGKDGKDLLPNYSTEQMREFALLVATAQAETPGRGDDTNDGEEE